MARTDYAQSTEWVLHLDAQALSDKIRCLDTWTRRKRNNMSNGTRASHLVPMSDETRGKTLQERMFALGLDESKLARQTGKDRGTIRRAFAGQASETTYAQLETWFDREERKNSGGELLDLPTHNGHGSEPTHVEAKRPVVIHVEEGGSFAIEGPADTPEEVEVLKELAKDLMREMRLRKSER
jgi:hypothetical protein